MLRQTAATAGDDNTTGSPSPGPKYNTTEQDKRLRPRSRSATMPTSKRFEGANEAGYMHPDVIRASHGVPTPSTGPHSYTLDHQHVEGSRPCSAKVDLERHEMFGMLGDIPLIPSPGPMYEPSHASRQTSGMNTPPAFTMGTKGYTYYDQLEKIARDTGNQELVQGTTKTHGSLSNAAARGTYSVEQDDTDVYARSSNYVKAGQGLSQRMSKPAMRR